MDSNTPNLTLPLLASGQAQKHITHNEALMRLDRLCALSVVSRQVSTPPEGVDEGVAYLIGADQASNWQMSADVIAHWREGAWLAEAPKQGQSLWVSDEQIALIWNGTTWQQLSLPESPSTFGVNASADDYNRLVVKTNSLLFSHDDVTPGSGDVRATLNKSDTGNSASVIFQNNWSGRAEFGLIGSDNFALKVSADGSTFHEAMRINPANAGIEVQSFVQTPFQRLNEVWIDNDQVHDYALPTGAREQGLLMVSCDDVRLSALVAYDVSSSPFLFMLGQADNTMLDTSAGVLTGLSGASGRATLSPQVGSIHIENRLGSTRGFRFLFLG